jgi:DNA-binding NarL/FixJ family response regulator
MKSSRRRARPMSGATHPDSRGRAALSRGRLDPGLNSDEPATRVARHEALVYPALLTLLRAIEDHDSVVQTPGVLPVFGGSSQDAKRSDEPQTIGGPIRILIVEKQQFIADALLALLSQQPGMVVVGNVGSMAESAPELNPDIVILDFRLNDRLAADAARALYQERSEAKVIFMTEDESDNVLLAAIDAGASAVLYLSTAAAQVIDAIRTVAIGGTLIPPHTIATLLTNRRKTVGVRDSLTSRELEILRLMAEGISNRDIAGKLGISYVTVRSHIRNLAGKLAAHSKLEVLAKAQELDLVESRSASRVAFA